ncbi:MAG: 4Fe-4S dicluster domain-containing protein [Candidatus Hadarchaeales archaeon]
MVGITDQLRATKPQPDLVDRFYKVVEKLKLENPFHCYQCFKCTSGCTSFRLTEIMPHSFVNFVRLGFVEDMMRSELLWACCQCLKCKERCPQDVAPVDVIFLLRRMTVSSGAEIPEDLSKIIMNVTETGFIQGIQKVKVGETSVDREQLGLPPITLPNLEKFSSVLMKAMEEQIE